MSSRRVNPTLGRQTSYILRTVWQDLVKRKISTLLTVLVIAASLTIPTVSYLLWKNIHQASIQFSPNAELMVYLHKNISDEDANFVVGKIRQQEGVASLNYISRQESLNEFRSWSGFGEELDILDDNPLPAVVMIKPTPEFNSPQKRENLRVALNKIKGVQEVHLDNDWQEKLTALTWLAAHVALFCALLMTITVFLVVGNSIRAEVYASQAKIDVMKLLGATDQFILRPYLYTGIIYAVFGGILAFLFSTLSIGYFSGAVKYVTDIFAVQFDLHNLSFGELIFLLVSCVVMGYVSAWLSATRHIKLLEKQR